MTDNELAPTRRIGADTLFAAFEALKDNGGELPMREVLREVESRVELDDWAKEKYEKTGYIRWQSVLHFFSIDAVKAGFLVKKKGVWFLTEEGEAAMSLGAEGLLSDAQKKYREWKKRQPPKVKDEDVDDTEVAEGEQDSLALEQVLQTATEGLERHIRSLNAYEFQDLVAALLRGMGYYIPMVSPRGKDGGIDIVAYRDPLGTVSPRIKVQVKHRPDTSTPVHDVRQLMGILQKGGDVGIFVSTGGYTTDAKVAARESHVHVELLDLSRFIDLWQDFYPKLDDADKALMPLMPVFFLAPEE